MIWLIAYVVIFLLLVGLVLRYGFNRRIPMMCFSCVDYDTCNRNGNCRQHNEMKKKQEESELALITSPK
jgi:hypothetical protein